MFIFLSNQTCLEHVMAIFYSLRKDIFNNVMHAQIKDGLTFILKGFMVKSQISNLIINLFWDHNSCISGLNEQCKGTLGIYIWRNFQWNPMGPVWCLFALSTMVLNTRDSRMNKTNSKMWMHLRVIRLNFLHPPPFVKMYFILEHTLLASCVHAFHT